MWTKSDRLTAVSDTVNVHEAKTHLSRLLVRVERGERIVIARSGRPIAVLSPLSALSPEPRSPGHVSSASAWEIALKVERGRLRLPLSPERYLPAVLARFRLEALDVRLPHALRAGALPVHHRDPFDRLLVAQAQIEDMPLVTADPAISRYDVETIG